VWGPDDQLGTLNRITPEVVAAAAGCVRSGERIGVSLPLDEPSPPFFGRKAMTHGFYRMGDIGWDDWLDGFYLQCSSQWDGLRHIRGADGFYGGWQGDPSADPGPLGIQHWAARGIIGRGVLIDLAAGEAGGEAGEDYDPFTARRFTVADIQAALTAQGAGIRAGDILCVRTGWIDKYLQLGDAARAEVALALATPRGYTCAGLSGSEEISRFLWDSGAAAVAADNPAVETVPADPAIGFLHGRLIPSLGFAIGELFDFRALAAACHADRRYDFLFTSVPLNVPGGVGSPANAVVIR
jgi:hypothetical protein